MKVYFKSLKRTLRLDNLEKSDNSNIVKSKYSQVQKMWHEWKRSFFYDLYAVARERTKSEKYLLKF